MTVHPQILEGRTAYLQGKEITENPHPRSQRKDHRTRYGEWTEPEHTPFSAWNYGFTTARIDAERAVRDRARKKTKREQQYVKR